MAGKKSTDQYANIAAVLNTETVAGTAAYTRFNFPYSVTDKVALLISRIEYWLGNIHQLNTSQDYMIAALCAASSLVSLENQADPGLIDSCKLYRLDLGAAASGLMINMPIIKDFSALPGGGILVAPSPLYAGIIGSGAGGVVACWTKVFYTYKELATDEYWELVESRRIIST